MEELGLRRVEVFRRHVGGERPAAEADDAAAEIGDREDHPVAEAVIGDGNIVAGDEQPRLDHLLLRDALAGEMLLQRVPVRRRIADAEAALEIGPERAGIEIAARRRPDAELQGKTLRAVSSLMLALLSGLATQYLADPERAPSVEDIVAGLRFIGKALG